MPYIYKITNDINDKIYIGKTLATISKRWKEHCKDFNSDRNERRPLYSAMRKYGVEHFHIEEVEQCDEKILNEREKYWIEYFGSFKYGYNATIGGDGRRYLDYEVIVATYNQLKNQTKTAKSLNISVDSVRQALKNYNVKIFSNKEVNTFQKGKIINQISLDNNFIRTFPSAREAARFIKPESKSVGGVAQHILEVCKGKRKTAYGYYWEYENILNNSVNMGS